MGVVRAFPAALLGLAIFWGLLRTEPTTPSECIRVTVAGHQTFFAGRSGWQHTFIVIADTGASAQIWSEPVRAPFDTTYLGPALLAIRHGAWFGDHTTLGRQCAAADFTSAPLPRDPHLPAGYLRADLEGAPGTRLFLLTAFIEIAILFEGWRLWGRWRRGRARPAPAHGPRHTASPRTDSATTQLPDAGPSA